MATVYDALCDSAGRYPDNSFQHIPATATIGYREGPVDLSYRQLLEQVNAQRARYAQAGYGIGHRVALMLANRADFFVHWFALNALGAGVVPINAEMQPDEQAYLLNHSESCLLVALPEFRRACEELGAVSERAVPVVTVDSDGALPEAVAVAEPGTPQRTTECAVLYTSGSTGKPKGCLLSNDYFLTCGHWYVNVGGLCAVEPGVERLITPLPLVHMNAMATSAMAMLVSGGCIVQLDRFHPRSWWRSVRESRATIVHYLGVMPAVLLGFPVSPDDDFSGQVKFGFGAGINPKHHAAFERRFGFPLIEAWAMTETGCAGCIIANREPRHPGTSCFGRPGAHVEVRLVDEQGSDVGVDEPGELLVRAPGDDPAKGFFDGYLKDPRATAKAWEGGWLHTGDVARRDADGLMYFVDRRKNVIRRSGENIAALEVEAALAGDPDIDMAIVCPVPDEIRGDEVMACIVAKPGVEADGALAERIVARCLESLTYFKVPGWIAFCDTLPTTASQKPRRAEVKTLALQRLEEGSVHDTRHLKKRRQVSA